MGQRGIAPRRSDTSLHSTPTTARALVSRYRPDVARPFNHCRVSPPSPPPMMRINPAQNYAYWVLTNSHDLFVLRPIAARRSVPPGFTCEGSCPRRLRSGLRRTTRHLLPHHVLTDAVILSAADRALEVHGENLWPERFAPSGGVVNPPCLHRHVATVRSSSLRF